MTEKERIVKIIEILETLYPDAKCSLEYRTPHEVLVATILSAQCTDDRVNIVTKTLFKKYSSVEAFAEADLAELEQDIYSTGFYRNKAKNIIESARQIIADFGGVVPQTIEELTTLAGVGRKTANLIVGEVYGKPAVVVDTHVKRITKRLGFTVSDNPTIVERELRLLLPKEKSMHFNHLLIYHGRAVCKSMRPQCSKCGIACYCKFAKERF